MDLEAIPDETTILKFRHFLERHGLTEALFRLTRRYLSERGLLLNEGTLVDASIISASSSTKNRGWKRDPEMKQPKMSILVENSPEVPVENSPLSYKRIDALLAPFG